MLIERFSPASAGVASLTSQWLLCPAFLSQPVAVQTGIPLSYPEGHTSIIMPTKQGSRSWVFAFHRRRARLRVSLEKAQRSKSHAWRIKRSCEGLTSTRYPGRCGAQFPRTRSCVIVEGTCAVFAIMVRHSICFSPSGYAIRRQALEKLLFFAYQGPVYSAEGLRPSA
jgi:hypothetical protein